MDQNKFIRKSNRLPYYNYNSNNAYFVTLCTFGKQNIFGEIKNSQSVINFIGKIIYEEWIKLTDQFDNIYLDEFVIMPNHLHAIIIFYDKPINKSNSKNVNLSNIIRIFKARVIVKARSGGFTPPNQKPTYLIDNGGINPPLRIWQKSFYDHVIRNQADMDRVREYIYVNPLNWELDELNPNIKTKLY